MIKGVTASGTVEGKGKAKTVYAERGDVNSCVDWLAVALLDVCALTTAALIWHAFKACLKDNGIEVPKVDLDRHGAIGRFKMCAGLMLRRHVSKVGYVVIGGKKIAAPGAKRRERRANTEKAV